MLVPSSNLHSKTHSALFTPSSGDVDPTAIIPSSDKSRSKIQSFDRPVLLQQSPFWSRVIIWSTVASVATILGWASVSKFDEAIPATGQLEPQGAVKEVQIPIMGVVKTIYVKDGQRVKKGELLLRLDSKGTQAELRSLSAVRQSLLAEQAFYQQQTQHAPGQFQMPASLLQIPAQMLSLATSRQTLISETQFYRAQLRGDSDGAFLTIEQQMRLHSSLREASSRSESARLQTEQLQKQFLQAQIQQTSAIKTLETNQAMLSSIKPVVESGGLAKFELFKQQESVQKARAEVDRLQQEKVRLNLAIAESREKRDNTVSLTQKDLLAAIAMNEKQIAEIESQFAKVRVEIERQIAEIDRKLVQTQQTLSYQQLLAPVEGVVFELKAHAPGFVANPSEPILKVVPSEGLVAKVYITNRDIGFVRTGMNVDVRIDSFPLSEFGDIKGKLTWIGSDALPPTQTRNFYSFPAKVLLESQALKMHHQRLSLQSGMGLSVNIKTRQRTVMSVFTDLFTGEVESLKHLR